MIITLRDILWLKPNKYHIGSSRPGDYSYPLKLRISNFMGQQNPLKNTTRLHYYLLLLLLLHKPLYSVYNTDNYKMFL